MCPFLKLYAHAYKVITEHYARAYYSIHSSSFLLSLDLGASGSFKEDSFYFCIAPETLKITT